MSSDSLKPSSATEPEMVSKEFYRERTLMTSMSHLGMDISTMPNSEKLSLVHVFNGGKSVIFEHSGELFCFGENNKRSLGIKSEKGVYTPTKLEYLQCSVGLEALASGEGHVVALDKTGQVFTWGDNDWGQLGDGTKEGPKEKPCRVKLPSIKHISCGYRYTLALDEMNKVWYWGCLDGGVMKSNYTFQQQTEPKCITSGDIDTVSCGAFHAAVRTNSGLVMTWGWNGYGQLGHGHIKTVDTPRIIAELEPNIVHIACGRNSTLILDVEGYISIFGLVYSGNILSPKLVDTKYHVKAVAMAWRYDIFAFLDEELILYYWGNKVKLDEPTSVCCTSIVDIFSTKDTPVVYPNEAALIMAKKRPYPIVHQDETMDDAVQITEDVHSDSILTAGGDFKRMHQHHRPNSQISSPLYLNNSRLINRKKRKLEEDDGIIDYIKSINDNLVLIENRFKEGDMDEDIMFGRYIGCRLRKLNPSDKGEIKLQIENLFHEITKPDANICSAEANSISEINK